MNHAANHLGGGAISICFKSCNLPIKYEFRIKWWLGIAGIKAGTSYHDLAVTHPNQNGPYLQITPWSIPQLYHLILTLISCYIAKVHEAVTCYTEERKSSARKRKTDHILKCTVQQSIADKKSTQCTSSIHYGCYIPVSNISCRLVNGKPNCTAKLFSRYFEIFEQGITISLTWRGCHGIYSELTQKKY